AMRTVREHRDSLDPRLMRLVDGDREEVLGEVVDHDCVGGSATAADQPASVAAPAQSGRADLMAGQDAKQRLVVEGPYSNGRVATGGDDTLTVGRRDDRRHSVAMTDLEHHLRACSDRRKTEEVGPKGHAWRNSAEGLEALAPQQRVAPKGKERRGQIVLVGCVAEAADERAGELL